MEVFFITPWIRHLKSPGTDAFLIPDQSAERDSAAASVTPHTPYGVPVLPVTADPDHAMKFD